MSECKYLAFELMPRRLDRKTDVVYVTNCLNNSFLGHIEWHSRWRKYVFSPAEGDTIFDSACLTGIVGKLDEMMQLHQHELLQRRQDGQT